jgi:hypothetical protein
MMPRSSFPNVCLFSLFLWSLLSTISECFELNSILANNWMEGGTRRCAVRRTSTVFNHRGLGRSLNCPASSALSMAFIPHAHRHHWQQQKSIISNAHHSSLPLSANNRGVSEDWIMPSSLNPLVQAEVVEYNPDEDDEDDWLMDDDGGERSGDSAARGKQPRRIDYGSEFDYSKEQDLSISLKKDLSLNDRKIKDGSLDAEDWDRDEFNGYIGGCSLEEIANDYNVPLQYIVDCCMTAGAEPPIQPEDLLGHLINGESIFKILEVLNSYDNMVIGEIYSTFNVVSLAEYLDVEIDDVFAILLEEGGGTGLGVRSQLKNSEIDLICSLLGKQSLNDS